MDHDHESPIGDTVVGGLKHGGVIIMMLAFGYLFSMLGNMVYPAGPGAVAGGVLGLGLGWLLGWIVTGQYKDAVDDAFDESKRFVPGFVQSSLYGHPEFTLFVTVERLEEDSKVLNWWFNNDFYVRVKCGRNPVKSTCVKKNGQFFETFKLVVEPADKSVTFELTDQDIFAEDLLGQVAVPVSEIHDRLNNSGGKYTHHAKLYSEKTRAGTLQVTFRSDTTAAPFTTNGVQGVTSARGGKPDVYNSTYNAKAAPYGTFASYNYFDQTKQLDIERPPTVHKTGQVHSSAQLPPSGTFGGPSPQYAVGSHASMGAYGSQGPSNPYGSQGQAGPYGSRGF